jgi:hypothetical protein
MLASNPNEKGPEAYDLRAQLPNPNEWQYSSTSGGNHSGAIVWPVVP